MCGLSTYFVLLVYWIILIKTTSKVVGVVQAITHIQNLSKSLYSAIVVRSMCPIWAYIGLNSGHFRNFEKSEYLSVLIAPNSGQIYSFRRKFPKKPSFQLATQSSRLANAIASHFHIDQNHRARIADEQVCLYKPLMIFVRMLVS